ncbi:TPA: hypothetical protein ACWZTV_001986 [Klebsiella pneumoniae]
MNHTLIIDGVSLTDPSSESIREIFPDLPEDAVQEILDNYALDANRPMLSEFEPLNAWKTEQRNNVNAWRDSCLLLPVLFTYADKEFKATLENLNILKAYDDYLPPDAIWTAEDDTDLLLMPSVVSGILAAMQIALSEQYSLIHREARARKEEIEAATQIPESE